MVTVLGWIAGFRPRGPERAAPRGRSAASPCESCTVMGEGVVGWFMCALCGVCSAAVGVPDPHRMVGCTRGTLVSCGLPIRCDVSPDGDEGRGGSGCPVRWVHPKTIRRYGGRGTISLSWRSLESYILCLV